MPYSADVSYTAAAYSAAYRCSCTCVACIFFSCLIAAQSVKVASSLSSPKADISNTAGMLWHCQCKTYYICHSCYMKDYANV